MMDAGNQCAALFGCPFRRFIHEPLVAIAAFNLTGIFGDLQPDTRMAKRPITPIAGDATFADGFGFGGVWGHQGPHAVARPVRWAYVGGT